MDWSLGEQRAGISAVVADSAVVSLASGGDDDRSVFEKGFGVLRFEPEAAELAEDVALPLSVEVLVEGEGTADFADAAARLIAAIPLALTAEM